MSRRALEEVVTLEVGKDDKQVKFTVHQNMLCAASLSFQAACKPEWMKREDRVIKLPEDDPEAMRVFIYWVYHDKISIPMGLKESNASDDMKEAMKTVFGLLTKLYLVGEK